MSRVAIKNMRHLREFGSAQYSEEAEHGIEVMHSSA
jgi:hypothetical protein